MEIVSYVGRRYNTSAVTSLRPFAPAFRSSSPLCLVLLLLVLLLLGSVPLLLVECEDGLAFCGLLLGLELVVLLLEFGGARDVLEHLNELLGGLPGDSLDVSLEDEKVPGLDEDVDVSELGLILVEGDLLAVDLVLVGALDADLAGELGLGGVILEGGRVDERHGGLELVLVARALVGGTEDEVLEVSGPELLLVNAKDETEGVHEVGLRGRDKRSEGVEGEDWGVGEEGVKVSQGSPILDAHLSCSIGSNNASEVLERTNGLGPRVGLRRRGGWEGLGEEQEGKGREGGNLEGGGTLNSP